MKRPLRRKVRRSRHVCADVFRAIGLLTAMFLVFPIALIGADVLPAASSGEEDDNVTVDCLTGSTITTCSNAFTLCVDTCFYYDLHGTGVGGVCSQDYYFDFYIHPPAGNVDLDMSSNDSLATISYLLIGPMTGSDESGHCSDVQDTLSGATFIDESITPLDTSNLSPGRYFVVIRITQAENEGQCPASSLDLTFTRSDAVCVAFEDSTLTGCENCYVATYLPEPGDTVLVSAWVMDANASPSAITYTDPQIRVEFSDASIATLQPSGQIIDGWQRIMGTFVIPSTATSFGLNLISLSGESLFDDVRVQPLDASMKCYVYDPRTMRFIAELDERHYSTFYEYDREGKLTRIKKETERGIMTIQENRTYAPGTVTASP